MGAIIVEDRRLALARGEQLQDAAYVRPAGTAGQFAVAERAGPAFAEKIVALRLEGAARVEACHITDALPHRRPAFEDERPITLLGEKITRDQPRRPGADDDGPMLQGLRAVGGHRECGLL